MSKKLLVAFCMSGRFFARVSGRKWSHSLSAHTPAAVGNPSSHA